MPDLPGQEEFQGELMHSSAYMSGSKWKGGKAIVLGTGNSGHDVAHRPLLERCGHDNRPTQYNPHREPKGSPAHL